MKALIQKDEFDRPVSLVLRPETGEDQSALAKISHAKRVRIKVNPLNPLLDYQTPDVDIEITINE